MKPTELMKACGSKTGQFEPESADQWRWMLANAAGEERALAWIRLKSIGNGSPLCVDETGKQIGIGSLAADCDWKLHTAQNVCDALANQGRIRTTKKGQIWYRADVPEKRRIEGEQDSFVQRRFPTYLADSIEKLPEAKKQWFLATYEAFSEWRQKVVARHVAEARAETEQVEHTIFAAVAVEIKKLPKRRDNEPIAPFEVTPLDGSSVQSQNGSNGSHASESVQNGYKVQNGFAQSGASLLSSAPTSDKSQDASQPAQGGPAGAKSIHDLLIGEWGEKFPGESPTSKLCRQILAALKGAPLQLLAIRLRQKKSEASTSMGFALRLAHDVGQRWKQDRHARANQAQARAFTEADYREAEEVERKLAEFAKGAAK